MSTGEPRAGCMFRLLSALALALVLGAGALAAEGERRGFLAESRADGTSTVRAWIQIDRRRTLFYAVSVDSSGDITRVCSEPSPIPESALDSPSGDIDKITTWIWRWLTAKGHGRLLVAFWETPTGIELAAASTRGTFPPACG